jgi:hypothetical protein
LINDENVEFNSSNVFSALALFNQLTVPLFIFPITIPIIISSLISTRRIERFLSCAEIEKEFDGIKHMARVLCKSNGSLDDERKSNKDDNDDDDDGEDDDDDDDEANNAGSNQIGDKFIFQETIDEEAEERASGEIKKIYSTNEEKDLTGATSREIFDDDIVVLRNKNNCVKLKKQNQLSMSVRTKRNRLRSTAADVHTKSNSMRTRLPSIRVPDNIAVCIHNAKFSWDCKKDSKLLEIDNLSIPKGIFNQ